MENHSYIGLSNPRCIRILVLEPASSLDAELRGQLCEAILDSRPEYHALSYVWGVVNPQAMAPIWILAPSGSYQPLRITPNCYQALKHLRYPDRPRSLWVDAICIDQQSNSEKSSQVAMMETIYYTASKVVVWLDLSAELPADKTAAAFSVLERITQLYKDHSIRLDPDDTYRRSKIMVTMHEMMCLRQTTPYAEIFYTILQNPYFTRVWTVQEVAFAPLHTLDVVTRYGSFPWIALMTSVAYLFGHNILKELEIQSENPVLHTLHSHLALLDTDVIAGIFARDDAEDRIATVPMMGSVREAMRVLGVTELVEDDITVAVSASAVMLDSLHALQATEPKDKAYASLWALKQQLSRMAVDQCGYSLFQVDYSKTMEQVYTELAVVFLQNLSNSAIYLACQRGKSPSLPSWVPDWSQSDGYHEIRDAYTSLSRDIFQAGGPSQIVTDAEFDGMTLIILGSTVAAITHCVQLPLLSSSSRAKRDYDDDYLFALLSSLREIFAEVDRRVEQGSMQRDTALRMLTSCIGFDRTTFMQASSVEKRVAHARNVEVALLRVQVLGELCSAFTQCTQGEGDDGSAVDIDMWFAKMRDVLGPFVPAASLDATFDRVMHLQVRPLLLICELAAAFHEQINFYEVTLYLIYGGWGQGKTVFLTECGRLGMSLAAHPGDLVGVFKGIQCPVILRKTRDTRDGDEFRLVSIAYVEDMMSGESYVEEQLVKLRVV